MVRSAPAVAALVLLALTGSRMLTAACEIACLYAAAVPGTAHSVPAAPASGHGCHEPAAPTEQPVRMVVTPHAACGHPQGAEPFVFVTKSARNADTPVVRLSVGFVMETLESAGLEPLLCGHAPPGPPPARVVPLRL